MYCFFLPQCNKLLLGRAKCFLRNWLPRGYTRPREPASSLASPTLPVRPHRSSATAKGSNQGQVHWSCQRVGSHLTHQTPSPRSPPPIDLENHLSHLCKNREAFFDVVVFIPFTLQLTSGSKAATYRMGRLPAQILRIHALHCLLFASCDQEKSQQVLKK